MPMKSVPHQLPATFAICCCCQYTYIINQSHDKGCVQTKAVFGPRHDDDDDDDDKKGSQRVCLIPRHYQCQQINAAALYLHCCPQFLQACSKLEKLAMVALMLELRATSKPEAQIAVGAYTGCLILRGYKRKKHCLLRPPFMHPLAVPVLCASHFRQQPNLVSAA